MHPMFRRTLLLGWVWILLGGGGPSVFGATLENAYLLDPPVLEDPVSPSVDPVDPPPPPDPSLWSRASTVGFLFEDLRALREGDIVLVRIVESAQGVKKASTQSQRNSTLKTGIAALFGLSDQSRSRLEAETETSAKFDGSGTTSRSAQLTATVTARVVRVLPNGNLVIEGRKEVMVNKEKQFITVQGIARPVDIRSDNSILSTQLANARIAFTGKGVLQDKQRPGWLIRILDWIWPF